MCDYSLMAFPNRLAETGEELVVHRFPSGSIGLASQADIALQQAKSTERRSFWSAVRDFFTITEKAAVPAVCIPPGARLRMSGLTEDFRSHYGFHPDEVVTFEQVTPAVNTYRDALRFWNGRVLLLQVLNEGQRITVVDLAGADMEPAGAIRELVPRPL